MSQPVTTGQMPMQLKQGVKAPMPAKHATAHRVANAKAAAANKQGKSK